MKAELTILDCNYDHQLIAVIHANTNQDLIYALGDDHRLLTINVHTAVVSTLFKVVLTDMDMAKPIGLQLSPDDAFISITNTFGQFGYVYDLNTGETALNLDRKDYHVKKSKFPNKFFQIDEINHLVYGTDWNHLDIYNFGKKQLITERSTNKYKGECYLDYFYGELHLSPGNKWLLSSGWVWHPVSVMKFIDLQKWLSGSITEAEQHNAADIPIWSYYWDRAIDFINDEMVAILYHSKEADPDEEDLEDLGVEANTGYVMCYNILKGDYDKKIAFNDFSVDDYSEPTPDCRLFYNGFFVVSSKEKGTFVLDPENGEVVLHKPDISLDQFHKDFNDFYKLMDNNKIELVRITE